jgi:hypothetical protein
MLIGTYNSTSHTVDEILNFIEACKISQEAQSNDHLMHLHVLNEHKR